MPEWVDVSLAPWGAAVGLAEEELAGRRQWQCRSYLQPQAFPSLRSRLPNDHDAAENVSSASRRDRQQSTQSERAASTSAQHWGNDAEFASRQRYLF